MGRKALFTQDQVFAVADALYAELGNVSASLLHQRLGGASLTTIYQHLNAWQAAHVLSPPVPTMAMPEPVRRGLDTVWQVAWQEAQKDVAAIREKANQELREVNMKFEEALAFISQLERDADADSARIESLASEVHQLRAELTLTAEQRQTTESQLEDHRRQLAASQSRELDMRLQYTRTNALNEQLEQELDRCLSRLGILEQQSGAHTTRKDEEHGDVANVPADVPSAAGKPRNKPSR